MKMDGSTARELLNMSQEHKVCLIEIASVGLDNARNDAVMGRTWDDVLRAQGRYEAFQVMATLFESAEGIIKREEIMKLNARGQGY